MLEFSGGYRDMPELSSDVWLLRVSAASGLDNPGAACRRHSANAKGLNHGRKQPSRQTRVSLGGQAVK
jgi:hypothetical protein